MIDALKLSTLDRSKPLTAYPINSFQTCALCDGPLDSGDWAVTLPQKCGKAHTHCAGDAGWRIK